MLEEVRSIAPDRRIVLAGDSAGANLALSVALRSVDNAEPGIAGLVLLSPHLDQGPPDSVAPVDRTEDARSDVDDVAAKWLRAAYCGEIDPADPRVSPLRADPVGLPPTLVQVGTVDATLADAVRFARSARSADVDVTLDIWDGLWHAWHYHRDLPEADRALAEVGRFIAELG